MTVTWLKATAIRVVRTFAQSFVAMCGATVLITELDWRLVLSAAGMSALICFFTCLAGIPEAPKAKKVTK